MRSLTRAYLYGRLRELNSTVDGKTLGYFTVQALLLLLLLLLLNITYCSEFLNKDKLLLLLLQLYYISQSRKNT